ncbi:MAG TPA: cupin domain-containing protein [Actinoplanes sp.]|nr:cupin domain-containing protein [Actinoplanes sp.]
MLLIRTSNRERLTADTVPPGYPASSVGRFRIRTDGTARFDRHYHHVAELWFVAAGAGTVAIGDQQVSVTAGDILHTPAGTDHDIVAVRQELLVFWWTAPLPDGVSGAHLYRTTEQATKHLVTVDRESSHA